MLSRLLLTQSQAKILWLLTRGLASKAVKMEQNRKTGLGYYISFGLWLMTVVFWIVLWFFNPYASSAEAVTGPGIIMFVAALFGILASAFRKEIVLILLALVSLFPIGLYLIGAPSFFALIGILNIASLVMAIYLFVARLKRQKSNAQRNR